MLNRDPSFDPELGGPNNHSTRQNRNPNDAMDLNEDDGRMASQENPQHPYSDSNNDIEKVTRSVQGRINGAPTAHDIMKMITGLPPAR